MMDIRALAKEDLPILIHWFNNPVALFLSSPDSEYPYTLKSIETDLLNEKTTYAMEVDGELIGCISINEINRISHLFVLPHYRGNKYSKRLVEFVINKNKSLNVRVHKNQREHLNLFKRLNFQESSEVFEYTFELNVEPFVNLTLNE